ncbi:MAG: efflux RND transporter periplasmic adaptor subunit, partial [Xenococcus sp. (in: cyanobacteria)]
LYTDGAVTASNRDLKCLEKETARKRVIESKVTLKRIEDSGQEEIAEAQANLQRTINTIQQQQTEAQATLNQIAEIRPVDLVLAEAELEDATVGVQQAQAELDLASVRSPSDGQILKIHTWPGEIISDRGIVELGQTGQMYVKAEVYETDISRVRLGQQSTISSDGFPGQLQGKVDEIGLQIGKKEVLSTNPVVDVDARVVEVKIRLDSEDSQKVAGLTNLQVKVVIDSPYQ